jgi:hypothetical protein
VNGTEKGSKQNVGERTVVQPTLRKLREGWGTRTRLDGYASDVKGWATRRKPQCHRP